MGSASDSLLTSVADTLVPGVAIADDGTLRAKLAPFARAVAAHRPGTDFAAWSRAEREALIAEIMAEPGTAAGAGLRRVLLVAARTFYGDSASWPELGYRPMRPGTSWPPAPGARAHLYRLAGRRRSLRRRRCGAGAGGGVAACVLAEGRTAGALWWSGDGG